VCSRGGPGRLSMSPVLSRVVPSPPPAASATPASTPAVSGSSVSLRKHHSSLILICIFQPLDSHDIHAYYVERVLELFPRLRGRAASRVGMLSGGMQHG
jgi:hypothetical protein